MRLLRFWLRYDRERYKGRHLIKNAFCRLEDFRRVATRYETLDVNFLSDAALATALAFSLRLNLEVIFPRFGGHF